MGNAPLRLLNLPTRQALPWRWDIAQLELGCRIAWPSPGNRAWSARARRIGIVFDTHPGQACLAFEGYTLVGAAWSRDDHAALLCGPYVMPQFRDCGLELRLVSILGERGQVRVRC